MDHSSKTLDVVVEFINIGAGKAANALNMLLGTHIGLRVPSVGLLASAQPIGSLVDRYSGEGRVGIMMGFSGDVSGSGMLVFDRATIGPIVGRLSSGFTNGTPDDFATSILTEIGNIAINAIVGSISNMVQAQVTYSVPQVVDLGAGCAAHLCEDIRFALHAVTAFTVEGSDFSADSVLFFKDGRFAERFLEVVDGTASGER